MNNKLEKIVQNATSIGDEDLQIAYLQKEIKAIEDELTEDDLEDLVNQTDIDIIEIKTEIKALSTKK